VRRPDLLFEKILERLPRIVGPQTGRGRSFLLPCDPHFIEIALVPHIFFLDAFRDRLHAFEPAASIEKHALPARVQFETAFGTKPARRHSRQHGSALRAAGHFARARHIDRLWPHAVITSGGRHRGWLFPRLFARLYLAIPVLISMLTIFSCHRNLPSTLAYCLASRRPRQVRNPISSG